MLAAVDLAQPRWAHAGRNCHLAADTVPVLQARVTRYLQNDAPRLAYTPRARDAKRRRIEQVPVHRGQRKLLMSEVAFLLHLRMHLGYSEMTVIYAGAASGDHIPLLSALFPEVSFVCVDPREFTISETKRIRIVSGYMTNEMAATFRESLKGHRVALISDIRCVSEEASRPTESDVAGDMAYQLSWHKILAPDAALFKFRLPWDSGGQTMYLAGSIQLPVLGPSSTTEARLMVTSEHGGEFRAYSDLQYEEQMSHFNKAVRGSHVYPHPVDGGHIELANLCHCYDCAAELNVLKVMVGCRHELVCTLLGCPVGTHEDVLLVRLRRTVTRMQPDEDARSRGRERSRLRQRTQTRPLNVIR